MLLNPFVRWTEAHHWMFIHTKPITVIGALSAKLHIPNSLNYWKKQDCMNFMCINSQKSNIKFTQVSDVAYHTLCCLVWSFSHWWQNCMAPKVGHHWHYRLLILSSLCCQAIRRDRDDEQNYSQFSNIRCTQSTNINVSRLVLQLSMPNQLKPGVLSW